MEEGTSAHRISEPVGRQSGYEKEGRMGEETPVHRICARVGKGNVDEKGLAEGALPAKVVGMLKSLSRGWGRSRHQQTIGGGTGGRVP